MGAGAQRYTISETNPNDSIGGGGCLCSESKNEDCSGPYAVFYATEMDTGLSPHVVIGAACARHFVGKLTDPTTEIVKLGESTTTPDDIDTELAI